MAENARPPALHPVAYLSRQVTINGGGSMAKWWADRPAENVFLEVRRDNIGDDLQAPITSRRGTATGGYSLVPLVKPADLVVH
jgi:hypothetical protein